MSDILDEICTSGLCHGCGACAAALPAKIGMTMSSAGYLRPVNDITLSKDDEATIRAVCSGLTIEQETEASSAPYVDRWGPILSVETAYATDPEVRFKGSSGGVITAVAIHLLRTGAVEFVVQTAADPDDPVGNVTVVSHTPAEVMAAAGSRYAPSSPLADLERYLSTGKRFAFIGKPCDVASLRRMQRRDVRIKAQIPYALAFFCAGVPSRKGAIAVTQALGVEEQDLVAFVYRGRGWPGLTRAIRKDGTEETMAYGDSWGSILNRHLQFRCKICPDGIGEFADIVCADAWYGEDGYPSFVEADGRSLLLARTPTGRQLLNEMVAADDIRAEALDIGEISLMQPYQASRKGTVPARLFAMWLKGVRIPRFRLHLLSCMLRTSPLWLARNLLGTYQRLKSRHIEERAVKATVNDATISKHAELAE